MCESRQREPDNAWGDVMHCFCSQCEGGEDDCVGYIDGFRWLIT